MVKVRYAIAIAEQMTDIATGKVKQDNEYLCMLKPQIKNMGTHETKPNLSFVDKVYLK